MKYLWSILLSLCLLLGTIPAQANTPEFNCYVAIIASPDLSWMFKNYPKWKRDMLVTEYTWAGLPEILKIINELSGDEPIFLDFLIHGEKDGVFLHDGTWRKSFIWLCS